MRLYHSRNIYLKGGSGKKLTLVTDLDYFTEIENTFFPYDSNKFSDSIPSRFRAY